MEAKSSVAVGISIVLKILALLCAVGCVVVLVTANFSPEDGTKVSFKDIKTYRFVLSVAVIGITYLLFGLTFAFYYIFGGKKLLSEIDFYGDKIISAVLGLGVGAGLAVTYELKEFLNRLFDLLAPIFPDADSSKSTYNKFLIRGYIASGCLAATFLCVLIISFISSMNRATKTSKGFFR